MPVIGSQCMEAGGSEIQGVSLAKQFEDNRDYRRIPVEGGVGKAERDRDTGRERD